ncbi:MAG: Flp family type IVb pilin [Bdellovibrionales bacterium]
MLKMLAIFDTYLRDDEGATAIEYGLMGAAIALGIIALVFTLGDRVEGSFQSVDDSLAAEGL